MGLIVELTLRLSPSPTHEEGLSILQQQQGKKSQTCEKARGRACRDGCSRGRGTTSTPTLLPSTQPPAGALHADLAALSAICSSKRAVPSVPFINGFPHKCKQTRPVSVLCSQSAWRQ